MKKQERIEQEKAELIKCLDQFSTKEQNIHETLFNVYRNAILWLLEYKELAKNTSAGDEEAISDFVDRNKDASKEEILRAAKKICYAYFKIASEAIGEDEVRRKRDELLTRPNKQDPEAGGAEKNDG